MFIVPYCTALWYDFRNMDILSRKGVTEMPSSTRDLRFYDLSHPRGRSAPLWPISLTLRSKEGRIMKQSHVFFLGKALLLLAVLVLLPACSGPSQGSAPGAPKEILLGASLPESGALAGFGVYLKWSYTTAI